LRTRDEEAVAVPTAQAVLRKAYVLLPLVATALLLFSQSLWIRSALHGLDLYSDEYFHVKQVRRFCRGDFRLMDGLTMIPGYHAVSAVFGALFDSCGRRTLRTINLGWGLAATLSAYLVLSATRSQRPLTRTWAFYFLPLLLPYHFVVYTDVLAIVIALLAIYFVVEHHYNAAAIAAMLGTFVRQPNAVLLVFIAGVAFIEHCERGRLSHWLPTYLKRSAGAWLGMLSFGVFVLVNGGVAVSDRAMHPVGFHLGNVYFTLFLLCFASLPVALEAIWRNRAELASLPFALGLAALYVAYMATFKVTHAYNEQLHFLRNGLLVWATQSTLTKALFFVPIAIGAAAVASVSFSRPAHWLLLPLSFLLLVPEELIEQRYAILPIATWMLLRRDAPPVVEALSVLCNAIVSLVLLHLLATGAHL
jgi:alpha-1,2-glucosyltransferase